MSWVKVLGSNSVYWWLHRNVREKEFSCTPRFTDAIQESKKVPGLVKHDSAKKAWTRIVQEKSKRMMYAVSRSSLTDASALRKKS